MKTALVLTGYMRNWEEHFPNIKTNIIDKYSTDVFISSSTYSELHIGSGFVNVDVDKVIEKYKPKKYLFRETETTPKLKLKSGIRMLQYPDENWVKRIAQQWYGVYLGSKLLDLDEYDVIIKCRSDLSVRNFELKPDKDFVLPLWKYHPGNCKIGDSYMDFFAYGKPFYMKKYFEMYCKLQEMHDNNWADISLSETLIKYYIDRYIGSDVITFDKDMDTKIRNEKWGIDNGKQFPVNMYGDKYPQEELLNYG